MSGHFVGNLDVRLVKDQKEPLWMLLRLRNNFITLKGNNMHYRNGREAKNGDMVISLAGYGGKVINGLGVLHDAVPGNDFCNGSIAPINGVIGACMCDCLHVDDLLAILAEKGLDKRPDGK